MNDLAWEARWAIETAAVAVAVLYVAFGLMLLAWLVVMSL